MGQRSGGCSVQDPRLPRCFGMHTKVFVVGITMYRWVGIDRNVFIKGFNKLRRRAGEKHLSCQLFSQQRPESQKKKTQGNYEKTEQKRLNRRFCQQLLMNFGFISRFQISFFLILCRKICGQWHVTDVSSQVWHTSFRYQNTIKQRIKRQLTRQICSVPQTTNAFLSCRNGLSPFASDPDFASLSANNADGLIHWDTPSSFGENCESHIFFIEFWTILNEPRASLLSNFICEIKIPGSGISGKNMPHWSPAFPSFELVFVI